MRPARWVTLLLLALLALVQGHIWFGRASVAEVRALRRELAELELANEQARQRNERLAAEVRDLREGLETVEEIARQELGLVKPDEIFVQIQRPAAAGARP
ncbi:Cell division protein FtsB [Tepidimonas sediminis]|uniref:Cell division protein FtsB n=1 Tax=Tepidimonas sediminis TaxID=2588941 RepID=A0A554WSG6_9BURK|nr:septum formation initiator family protein [Tepidimonas sediminis]TSE26503.1 Cell division protein FtsB [Tepidimonas sediminis]